MKIIFSVIALASALAASVQAVTIPASCPMSFESSDAKHFVAHGGNYEFQIGAAGSEMTLEKSATETACVRLQLIDANPSAKMAGETELPGRINYLIGDKSQWHAGIPTFAKVRVTEVYPGIDVVYYGNGRELEYDFNIAAGSNPDAIRLSFPGVDKISINPAGELILSVGENQIVQRRPAIYQMINGVRRDIAGGCQLLGKDTVAFSVGEYDHHLPLVIDPTLSYSTYFGGTSPDAAWSVAVSPVDGSVYMAGETRSSKLTKAGGKFSTPGAFQTQFKGGRLTGDAFVAKFDSTLTNLIYCTYLGGKADDGAFSIALDAAGDAYIAGFTDSSNFPVTPDALDGKINGTRDPHTLYYPVDAFVSVLDPSGSNLLYSTFLGGKYADAATGIALDSAGNIYVTGLTESPNFPVTNSLPGLNHLRGTNNAFVSEISADGSSLIFSTYLGGEKSDEGEGIAVDAGGYIYVTGYTSSTNFPTLNAYQPALNRGRSYQSPRGVRPYDAFLTKFNPSGAGLVYSTFFGGTNYDTGFGVTANSSGYAYITGQTTSRDFWNTNSFTQTAGTNVIIGLRSSLIRIGSPGADAFLAKFDPAGALVYSVAFGGSTNDFGYSVALDPSDDVYVTGTTSSTNFPVRLTANMVATNNTSGFPAPGKLSWGKGRDAFVVAVSADDSNLLYSAYIGGRGSDVGYGITVDAATNVYIVGQTASTNFPVINAYQRKFGGTNDAFLIKIEP